MTGFGAKSPRHHRISVSTPKKTCPEGQVRFRSREKSGLGTLIRQGAECDAMLREADDQLIAGRLETLLRT